MISELDRLRKKSLESNYGSKYATLNELGYMVDLYDQLRAEHEQLLDQWRSAHGFDVLQMWAELKQARAELEAIRKRFPAGQMEMFE